MVAGFSFFSARVEHHKVVKSIRSVGLGQRPELIDQEDIGTQCAPGMITSLMWYSVEQSEVYPRQSSQHSTPHTVRGRAAN